MDSIQSLQSRHNIAEYTINTPPNNLTNLRLFLHHSVFLTQNFIHVDDNSFQAGYKIGNFQIDPYGLICFNSSNKISLSKLLNSSREFNSNINLSLSSNSNKGRSKIHVLNQLVHENKISSFYFKNSLLISGQISGLISLWDINKAKSIYSANYLQYPINRIGAFLNFKQSNLYYANYSGCDNIVFCDIRTNKAVKIINKFTGNIDCQVNKNGILTGVSSNHLDFIDINRNFKSFKIQQHLLGNKQNFKLKVKSQNFKQKVKSQKNRQLDFQQQKPYFKIKKNSSQAFHLNLGYNNKSLVNQYDNGQENKILSSISHNYSNIGGNLSSKIVQKSEILSQNKQSIPNNKNMFKQREDQRYKYKLGDKVVRNRVRFQFDDKQNIININQQQNVICSSLIGQNNVYIGRSNGNVLVIPFNSIDLDLVYQYKDNHNKFTQIIVGQNSKVNKIIQKQSGLYILHDNGKLYETNHRFN